MYCVNEQNISLTRLCIPTLASEMTESDRRVKGECGTLQYDYFDPARYKTDFQWGIRIQGNAGTRPSDSPAFTNSSSSSSKAPKANSEEAWRWGSDKWSKDTLHSCYCFKTIQDSTVKDGLFLGMYNVFYSDGDICVDQIAQFVLAKYLFICAVMLVSVLNVVIQEGAKSIVEFERHTSKTAAAAQQLLKTFFGLLINTGFIILIVNSPFPSAVLGIGANTDEAGRKTSTGYGGFEALWYTQVGASIAISMGECSHVCCWCCSGALYFFCHSFGYRRRKFQPSYCSNKIFLCAPLLF